jgi:hypothetical protein
MCSTVTKTTAAVKKPAPETAAVVTKPAPKTTAAVIKPPPESTAAVKKLAPERAAPQSVSASKPEPTPPLARAVTKSAPEPRFARQLGAAQRAFRRGDYTVARTSLETLRKRIAAEGTPEDKSELWRQLTFVYVAFEMTDETCTAYGRLRRSAPDTSFDPDLVSVKIRRAVSACAAG